MPMSPTADSVQIADPAGKWPTTRPGAYDGAWPQGTRVSRTGAREACAADAAARYVRDVLADMMQRDSKG